MESIVATLLGTLGVALLTGVFAFAREQINQTRTQAREDVLWYRNEMVPKLEKQQNILEAQTELLKRAMESHRDDKPN